MELPPKLDMGQICKNEPVAVHSAPPAFPAPAQLMFKSIAEEKEPSYQSEENDEFHVSSNESLHELQNIARKRTISGNYSERSTSSSREVTYIRTIHDHQHIGTESRLLFTAGAGKGPFVITSVIPWQKTPKYTNRYLVPVGYSFGYHPFVLVSYFFFFFVFDILSFCTH